jgi:hypothetical protein
MPYPYRLSRRRLLPRCRLLPRAAGHALARRLCSAHTRTLHTHFESVTLRLRPAPAPWAPEASQPWLTDTYLSPPAHPPHATCLPFFALRSAMLRSLRLCPRFRSLAPAPSAPPASSPLLSLPSCPVARAVTRQQARVAGTHGPRTTHASKLSTRHVRTMYHVHLLGNQANPEHHHPVTAQHTPNLARDALWRGHEPHCTNHGTAQAERAQLVQARRRLTHTRPLPRNRVPSHPTSTPQLRDGLWRAHGLPRINH